jgi:hypothetical protein
VQLAFQATAGWVQDFKKKETKNHRHVTQYVSNKNNASFEETVKTAELFQNQLQYSQITPLVLECEQRKTEKNQIFVKQTKVYAFKSTTHVVNKNHLIGNEPRPPA